MLFSSGVFIFLFLPATMLGYHLTSKIGKRAEVIWLAAASLFFYGYWDASYLLLLVGSIVANFWFSGRIASATSDDGGRRLWLFLAIGANLLLLIWYKYFFPTIGFLESIGLQSPGWVAVVLPLGISFFTFTQIAFLVDLSEGVAQRQSFVSYVLFVTFFPHLIAGPIIHHAEMMPQFEARIRRGLQADDVALGMTWFVLGLSKKVLIADRFGPISDAFYAQPSAFGLTASWIAVLCYAIQLYFDFSGYSDMALGLARIFSIRFPFNFNSPYKASNIIEFWARWHMTLTRWLTAYLYNPISLSLNRRRMALGKKISRGANKTLGGFLELVALPTLLTMFLAGVWHGAGLQFMVFGLLHGVYLTANHAWRLFTSDRPLMRRLIPWPVGMALTAAAVLIGQIFFRAGSVTDAVIAIKGLVALHGGVALAQGPTLDLIPATSSFLLNPFKAAIALALCFAAVWLLPNTQQILRQSPSEGVYGSRLWKWLFWTPGLRSAVAVVALFSFCFAWLDASKSFLYFQF